MNDIEKRVLEILGENVDDPDVFAEGTDAFTALRASVNAGIQDICALTGTYTQTYRLVMLDDRQFYRVLSQQDYWGYPAEVWDRANKRKLQQTDLAALMEETGWGLDASGTPWAYGQLGQEVLWFWPFDGNDGRVIEVRAVMVPKQYSETASEVKVRGNYRDAAAYWGASEMFAARGDATKATEYFQRYMEAAQLMALIPREAERQYSQDRKPYGRWAR